MCYCLPNCWIHKKSNIFKEDISNQTNYYEVYSCLKNVMNFGWRKASQRPPRWFQSWLEEARKVFQNFINKNQEAGFVIVWIDESSFSSSVCHFTLGRKEDEMLSLLLDRVHKDLMLLLLNGIKKHILWRKARQLMKINFASSLNS